MNVGRRAVRGVVWSGIAAICLTGLAACSTVTYGTGVGTTTQTLQDMTRMLGIFNLNREFIEYQARPNLVIPQTANLPPPGTGTTPTDWPADTAPPTTAQGPNPCAVDPGDPAPPPQYCTPNPNAPAVTVPGAGLFGGYDPDNDAIRQLVDPCQWWQVTWNQLNEAEQEAWGRLGWNAGNWASTNTEIWPDTAGKLWRDLRLRERSALESLGFSQETWNACYL